MFGKSDIVIDYDKVLDFIGVMVQIHFTAYTQPYIDDLITKYDTKLLTHKPSKQELKNLCKEHEKMIVNNISEEYTKKHIYYYMSMEGYIRTIHSLLYQHAIDYIVNKLDEKVIARTGT